MPIFSLSEKLLFPPVHLATREGLLAVGGDLGAQRLLLAYRSGIFPWFSENDPILWWSPDTRLVIYPSRIHIPRRLGRTIRQRVFTLTMDHAFRDVIRACAENRGPKREDTWIVPEMIQAYCHLHQLGYAHSVEAWHRGLLAGGLYGVSMGGCFFGESMFSLEKNASQVCLVALAQQLQHWAFDLIDCQMPTANLMRFGAIEITRNRFIPELKKALQKPSRKGNWSFSS